MTDFLSGAIMIAGLTIGLFFFRFWWKTADRFFAIFALAFWMLAIERWLLVLVGPTHEFRPYVYCVRLIAFLLIVVAVIEKNRR